MTRCSIAAVTAALVLSLSLSDLASAQVAATGQRYAFLVAVREYPKAKLGKLRFVENDMDDLAAALKSSGYKDENIVRLSQTLAGQDGPGRGARYFPNGENIRHELDVLLGILRTGDSVLVAFAGHGVQFKGEKESYFCPADANLEQRKTLLPISGIYAQLKEAKARVKVLLVDACRNDPVIAQSLGPNGVELEPVGKPQEVEPPQGIAALFSCSAGQKAWEDVELRHGVFFSFVIAGLKGAADTNADGQVTYNELTEYSIVEVKRHARVKLGELQVPQPKGEFEGQIALVRIERPIGPPPPLAIAPFTAATAKKHQQDWAAYLKVQPVTTNSVNMKLALIPPGEFLMGAPAGEQNGQDDEKPQHRIRITRPYYLGVYEVTQGEYEEVVGSNPSFFSPSGEYKERVIGIDTKRFPVENVTWDSAAEFCRRLSEKEGKTYRLPTEAEWEYACRAGTTTAFHFGGALNGDNANVDGSVVPYGTEIKGKYLDRPTIVGSYTPNGFGLYDMHGNVWEWCQDWYDEEYYKTLAGRTTENPQGDTNLKKTRLRRGGSWIGFGWQARAAHRDGHPPGYRTYTYGFRVVRVP